MLLPVFQSAPAVWSIDFLEQKASVFLEVLQTQMTPIKMLELTGCPGEWGEVWAFLECLPNILQLR